MAREHLWKWPEMPRSYPEQLVGRDSSQLLLVDVSIDRIGSHFFSPALSLEWETLLEKIILNILQSNQKVLGLEITELNPCYVCLAGIRAK